MKKTIMKSFGASERVGHDSSGFYARKLFSADVINNNYQNEATVIHDCNKIHKKSSEAMGELPDNSVHLMVTSPPYNVGKEYDNDLSLNDYLLILSSVFKETYRVLVPGGRACINIANIGRKPYLPINAMINQIMLDLGYLMRGEIIWNKAASAGTSCAWGSWCSPSNPVLRDTHEYIMVFCKDGFARKKNGGEATITKDEFLEFTKSIWAFPAESARRVGHPAPFPVELPRRLTQLYTYTHDVVLDPFMGSGSTAIASIQSDRNWIGYDTSEIYVSEANKRIEKIINESVHC